MSIAKRIEKKLDLAARYNEEDPGDYFLTNASELIALIKSFSGLERSFARDCPESVDSSWTITYKDSSVLTVQNPDQAVFPIGWLAFEK